jgi:hypothetical protein
MIAGVTFGLLGLSAAFVSRGLRYNRLEQTLWVVSGLVALLFFASAPRPFAEVLVWASAGAIIWLSSGTEQKPELVHASAAGFLIGAGLPYVSFVLGDMVPWSVEVASLLLIGLACGAGAVLARGAGGVMAAAAGCLAIGALGALPVALATLVVSALAVGPWRHAAALGVAAFPFLPALALLEGTP